MDVCILSSACVPVCVRVVCGAEERRKNLVVERGVWCVCGWCEGVRVAAPWCVLLERDSRTMGRTTYLK